MTPAALEQQVSQVLGQHPHLQQRQLRIETHDDRVVLHGVVGSYFQKQLAQEALKRLDGVATIDNRLEVRW